MKLFVTDYDDTLYTNDISIKENIKKIKELKKKDFIIVIATGRSYPSIKNQILEKKIPYDYLSCADGSIIYDNQNKIIYSSTLNQEIVKPFEEFYKDLNYEEIQFSYPYGYSNTLDNNEKLLGINVCISTRIYNNKIEKKFFKLKKKHKNYNFLAYTHPNYSYLCIKPKDISKSSSIDFLKNKLNIKKEDIYIIGDSSNDCEMLHDFNGVGMTNSCDEVLKIVKTTYEEVSDYINEILKESTKK